MKKTIFLLLILLSVLSLRAQSPIVQEYANQDTIDNAIQNAIYSEVGEQKSDVMIISEKFEKISNEISQITKESVKQSFPEMVNSTRTGAIARETTFLIMLIIGLWMWGYQTKKLKDEHKAAWDLSDTKINYSLGLVIAGIAFIS